MTIVVHRNPFDPADRVVLALPQPRLLAEIAFEAGVDPAREPVIAAVDGRLVLQRDWAARLVAPGSVISFQVLPQGGGGGGGGGGKQILAAVLMVAVTVAAFAIAGPAAGFITGATSGFAFTAASAAIAAAITIGGTMLVNALIPPQPPSLGNFGAGRFALGGASPTYSMQGRGNTARLDQPIPVIYGRHLVYPDYAATPWWEYIDNEQYLYQLFVIGQGHYQIERIAAGEAEISSFDEISYEVIDPGGTVSLFADNVYSSAEVTGQTLKAENELDEGENRWVGPFPAMPSDGIGDEIGLDVILTRGLFLADSSGNPGPLGVAWEVAARVIDSNGVPQGEYVAVAAETLELGTVTPQRRSFQYTLPSAARWEVRVRRTDTKNTSARAGHDVAWGGLRSYLDATPSYGAVTLLAVKAKASDNLNSQTSRQFGATVVRKIPIWDGTAWSAPQPTSSIAWAAADVLRNGVYGGRLADTRYDLASLLALEQIWAARADEFNGVFDQASTVWDALGKVLRTGRAKPYHQAGLIRFHRDAPQALPVALFSTANVVKDSMTLDFVLPVDGDTADGVEAEYFDARIWKSATVTAGVAGVAPGNPAREQLFGVTSEAQASREAAYMAAANRYRRAFVTFQTELDGLVPAIGDPILVSHEVARWGHSGTVAGWSPASRELDLDGEVNIDDGATWYVRLRRSDGSLQAAIAVTQGSSPSRIVLASSPPFAVETGGGQEPTHYTLGKASAEARSCIVTQIIPRGSRVEVRAVVEDARAHVN